MPSDRSAAHVEHKLVYVVGQKSYLMHGDPALMQQLADDWTTHQDEYQRREAVRKDPALMEREMSKFRAPVFPKGSSVLPNLLLEGWVIKTIHAVSNHLYNEESANEGGAAAYVVLERTTAVAEFKIGDKLRGKVIRHDEHALYLDLWGKVTGCLPRGEWPTDFQPEVGGLIDVIVADNRLQNGCIRVTRGARTG